MINKLKKYISPLVQWRYAPWAKTRLKTYLPVTIWQGQTKSTGLPFSVVYVGEDKAIAAFWMNAILAENRKKHELGNRWVFSLPSLLKDKYPDASLLFVEENPLTPLFSFLRRGFLTPYWVQMEIDISKPIDQMNGKEKEGFEDVERRIRKNNLSCEFTDDRKKFEEFFHTMHTPFIRNRHEEESFFMSLKRARKIFEKAELCLIKKDGEAIGGLLIQTGTRATLRSIGLKDGNLEYIKYGTLGALYYFAIKMLGEKGYKVVDIGGSDPILNGGLTRFKSFLRAKVTPNTYLPLRFLRLIPLRLNPSVTEVLSGLQILHHPRYYNPLRAVFINAAELNNKEAVRKKLTSKSPRGIRGTEAYILGKYNQADVLWLKGEKAVVSVQSINSRSVFR